MITSECEIFNLLEGFVIAYPSCNNRIEIGAIDVALLLVEVSELNALKEVI